jgi:uncharacterized lipoprotein YddW (UPF0748 family)
LEKPKQTRRTFLQNGAFGIAGMFSLNSAPVIKSSARKSKNWIWISPNLNLSDDDWKKRFEKLKLAGIDALLPEIYKGGSAYFGSNRFPVRAEILERFIPLAKSFELEVHTWMWTMPCLQKNIQEKHPDWYNVNRFGESSLKKPAYVGYYKFLCPAKEEVHEFIQGTVEELSQFDVDGIHLDYVRYPDVILPKGLWSKYDLIQDKEYPQFDYCYCETCRNKFKEQAGIDPLKIKEPSEHKAWLQFRYDQVTNLVNNKLIPTGHKNGKIMSAAVFPNWKNVRQEWPVWKLDAVLPMLYNTYYFEDAKWIKYHCKKGNESLKFNTNLYSGLMIDKPDDLKENIQKSFEGDAKGISLFSMRSLKDEHVDMLSSVLK